MNLRALPLLLALGCFPFASFAWGPDGHQSIGAIADALLRGSKAGEKVGALLDRSTLEQVAVWADCVKGIAPEKDFTYTATGRYPECTPFETVEGIAVMSAYVRRNNDACKPALGEESCHKQYHYADVALQHDHYKTGYAGTSDHDIVHAIRAAVLALQSQPQPKPFQFKDQREALTVLTHLIADLHQPLHVGSVFLDSEGRIVDPDQGTYDKGTNTVGGNALQGPCGNVHALWDDIPQQFKRGRMNEFLTGKARSIARTDGAAAQWPEMWADDTIANAKLVFAGMQFGKSTPNQWGNSWSIAFPLEYEKTMARVKEEALVKAGAHLAQLLLAIWPE
ncbi:MAG: S1/P1 nuclease [Proteobacteria bacterium]|nr:S1/P1 nuclease [Pseudomonadota bacterium]